MVAVAAVPIYLWTAETTISEGNRGSSYFTLSVYRFRPVAVLEFQSQFRNAHHLVKTTFGAQTILRVDSVSWLPNSDSLSIELTSRRDSEMVDRPSRIRIDFKRNIALTDLDGSLTDDDVRLLKK